MWNEAAELMPIRAGAGRTAAPRDPLAGLVLRFDPTDWRAERDDDEVPRPIRRRGETLPLTLLAIGLVLSALLPISAAAAADLWRYLFS